VGNHGKPILVALCVETTSTPSATLWRAWKGKAAAEERGMAGGRERIQSECGERRPIPISMVEGRVLLVL
jgi:GTP cyclohydrolase III